MKEKLSFKERLLAVNDIKDTTPHYLHALSPVMDDFVEVLQERVHGKYTIAWSGGIHGTVEVNVGQHGVFKSSICRIPLSDDAMDNFKREDFEKLILDFYKENDGLFRELTLYTCYRKG